MDFDKLEEQQKRIIFFAKNAGFLDLDVYKMGSVYMFNVEMWRLLVYSELSDGEKAEVSRLIGELLEYAESITPVTEAETETLDLIQTRYYFLIKE